MQTLRFLSQIDDLEYAVVSFVDFVISVPPYRAAIDR